MGTHTGWLERQGDPEALAFLERELVRQERARLESYVASKVRTPDPVSAEAWRWHTWMA